LKIMLVVSRIRLRVSACIGLMNASVHPIWFDLMIICVQRKTRRK
jgi:hypothetical protein